MSTKAVFKQEMEAEVAHAQTELAGLQARGMALSVEAKKKAWRACCKT